MSLYTCYRCGHQTKGKNDMRKHLYNRKNDCPALSLINDIELTINIKEYILKNKVYHIPKIINNISRPNIINNIEEYHFIYMIRPKENVRHNENIYKIGKTKVKNPDINISRLLSYDKGTEIIHLQQCNNCNILEKELLEEFTKKFNKHTFGNEYFIGDKYDMLELIGELTLKHNKKYKI
jgi:hypothetical protein